MANTQPGFLELVWREEYACGHPTIDAQHRRLFVLGNALLDAILMEQPKPEIERLLVEFVDHARQHFLTEESILEAFDSGISETH
jgi:hemerythrin-like metal-binding protein